MNEDAYLKDVQAGIGAKGWFYSGPKLNALFIKNIPPASAQEKAQNKQGICPSNKYRVIFQNQNCSLKTRNDSVISQDEEVGFANFTCNSSDWKKWQVIDILFHSRNMCLFMDLKISCLIPKNQFRFCNQIKVSDINHAIADSPVNLTVDFQ